MKKTLIAAGISAVLAAPAAMADTTVYGKVRMSVNNIDKDANTSDSWAMTSHGSRLGVKGSEDLGNGLTAIYGLEFQVNVDTEDNTDAAQTLTWSSLSSGSTESVVTTADTTTPTLTARNQYVGLKGGFGTVLVGRHDTPYKMAGSAALFNDTIADEQKANDGIIQRNFETRAANAIAYITPTVNGLHAAVAVVPGEETSTTAGTAVANGLSDAISAVVVYENGPLKASYAYESYDKEFGTGRTADQTGKKLNVSYGMGDITLAGTMEKIDDTDGTENDAWLLSAKYKMGANDLLISYGEYDDDDNGSMSYSSAAGDFNMLNVGVAHNFSKRSQIMAIYTESDADTANTDKTGFAIQLNHSF